jgi:hypothetical protein
VELEKKFTRTAPFEFYTSKDSRVERQTDSVISVNTYRSRAHTIDQLLRLLTAEIAAERKLLSAALVMLHTVYQRFQITVRDIAALAKSERADNNKWEVLTPQVVPIFFAYLTANASIEKLHRIAVDSECADSHRIGRK